MRKCQYCTSVIKNGNAKRKYCSDSCRSLNWKSMKRLKKIKEDTRLMLDKANITVGSKVQELFKQIYGN